MFHVPFLYWSRRSEILGFTVDNVQVNFHRKALCSASHIVRVLMIIKGKINPFRISGKGKL